MYAGAAAKAHEQYMQALLLADLVMPVSAPQRPVQTISSLVINWPTWCR